MENNIALSDDKIQKDKGCLKLVLETGAPLIGAMALYRKMEYEITENYVQYKDMQDSICMKKYI